MQKEARLIGNPEIAALTALMMNDPAVLEVMDHIREIVRRRRDKGEGDEAAANWVTGAFFGVCASYMVMGDQAADGAEADDSLYLYAAFCQMVEEVWGGDGSPDWDETLKRLVPAAFSDEVDDA